jgi:predicted GH43/DUF377 family glycosyl hydrolase
LRRSFGTGRRLQTVVVRVIDGTQLFQRHFDNPILTAAALAYPAHTVFNPGATTCNGRTVLLARVEDRRGLSHLAVARSDDGITGWRFDDGPGFHPDEVGHPEEEWGVEDPRITHLPEREDWAIAYTAYGPGGPRVSLALTRDFVRFERLGPAVPPEDKDAAVFPRRIGGRWALLHRPSLVGGKGHIWISYSADLRDWSERSLVLPAREGGWWDANKVGLGPPPLETPEGWLVMYHGVRATVAGPIYRVGLALLDLEDPRIVRRRSDEWIFAPREPYEVTGDVGQVVFPCGWVVDEGADTLRMYYGAADTSICLATATFSGVMDHVLSLPQP